MSSHRTLTQTDSFPVLGGGFKYFGVSKNSGTPKWMMKIMVPNPIKMDDLGLPLFLETPIFFN